jgi:hypothetical protein
VYDIISFWFELQVGSYSSIFKEKLLSAFVMYVY